jgi:hypothetical protein
LIFPVAPVLGTRAVDRSVEEALTIPVTAPVVPLNDIGIF